MISIWRIPQREIVDCVALMIESVSIIILDFSGYCKCSPFDKVNDLLSSNKLLKFSIQFDETEPSKMIHSNCFLEIGSVSDDHSL